MKQYMKFDLFSKILEELDIEIVSLIYIYHKLWRREARWNYRKKFTISISLKCPEKFTDVVKPVGAFYNNHPKKWSMLVDVLRCCLKEYDFCSRLDFCMVATMDGRYTHYHITKYQPEYNREAMKIFQKRNGLILVENKHVDGRDEVPDYSIEFPIEMLYRSLKRLKRLKKLEKLKRLKID